MSEPLKATLLFHVLDLFLKGLAWGCATKPRLLIHGQGDPQGGPSLRQKLFRTADVVKAKGQKTIEKIAQSGAQAKKNLEARMGNLAPGLHQNTPVHDDALAHSPPIPAIPLSPQLIIKALARAPLVDLLQIFADCSEDERERILNALRNTPARKFQSQVGPMTPQGSAGHPSHGDDLQPLVTIRGGVKDPGEIPISGGPPGGPPGGLSGKDRWRQESAWDDAPASALILDLGFDEPLFPEGLSTHCSADSPANPSWDPLYRPGPIPTSGPPPSPVDSGGHHGDSWDPDYFSLRFDDSLKSSPPRFEDLDADIDSGMGIDHRSFLEWVDADAEPERPSLRRLEDPPPIFDDFPKPHFGRELRSFVLGRDDTPIPRSGPSDPEFEVLWTLSEPEPPQNSEPSGSLDEIGAFDEGPPLKVDPPNMELPKKPPDLFAAWNTFQPLIPRQIDPSARCLKSQVGRSHEGKGRRPRRSGAASLNLRPDPGRIIVRPRRAWVETALPRMGAPPEVKVRGAQPPYPRPQSRAGRLTSQKRNVTQRIQISP